MRLIDADSLKAKFKDPVIMAFVKETIDNEPTVEPTLCGYPIEHLEMIARVMAKENCTPEAVSQMLQNAGEVAKMVRDEMMKMLKESIERSCKGGTNE